LKIKRENTNFNYDRAAELHPTTIMHHIHKSLSFLFSHYPLAVGG